MATLKLTKNEIKIDNNSIIKTSSSILLMESLKKILDKNLILKYVSTSKKGVKTYNLITKIEKAQKETNIKNIINNDIMNLDNILNELYTKRKDINKSIELTLNEIMLNINSSIKAFKETNKETQLFTKKQLLQVVKNKKSRELSTLIFKEYEKVFNYYEFNLTIDFNNIDNKTFSQIISLFKLSFKDEQFSNIIAKNQIKNCKTLEDYKAIIKASNILKNEIIKTNIKNKIISEYNQNNTKVA